MSAGFLVSNDPRKAGSCARCARLEERCKCPAPPAPKPKRDTGYEEQFLKAVAETAASRAGVDASAFVWMVQHRLDMGQDVYGDANFHNPSFDMLKEACEEGPDQTAYSLLELQRRNLSGEDEDGGLYADLFAAAVHAAISDCFIRRARARAHER